MSNNQYLREYYNNPHNKEKIKARNKAYREKNKEKFLAKGREYYQANKDKVNAKMNEYLKTYRELNKDKTNKRQRERYKNDSEYRAKCLQANKNRKEKIREYYKNKRKNDPVFRFKNSLRVHICTAIRKNRVSKNASKKSYTLQLLGCSWQDAKQHIEKQWISGMSWENYGEWHIDHITPVETFNLIDIEQQKKCFHYTNLRPLWAVDNYAKNDFLPDGSRARLLKCNKVS